MAFKKPKYEVVMWTLHLVVTTLAIIDRFVTNVWPMQSFTIGAGSAGNDRMYGFNEGPWSVVAYDVLARFSGRFSIVCFNFMLISRLRFLEQYLASSWIGRHVFDCSNITKANIQAHRYNGIALCVLTLMHVWSILLPCMTHRYRAQIVPGVFEWPLSERTPPGYKDADASTQTMSLQVDDVFRLVEMTLLLGVLMPLSIRWLSRSWHLGIHVHRFITVLYFVDIVRRHSHPHSWVLNTPVFVIWIVDKVGCLVWRQVKSPNVIQQTISDDYMVLYWTVDKDSEFNGSITSVGSNFLMKMNPSSCLESAHPFTSFKNRAGSCNFLQFSHDSERPDYTHGAVIRTFHNDRKPIIGGEARSHTESFSKSSFLSIWGPFQGNMTELIPKSFHSGRERTIVLAGSGSAVNFQLDLLSQLSRDKGQEIIDFESDELKEVVLLYSTRDPKLFQFVVEAMHHLLGVIEKNKRFSDGDRPKIRVLLSCTADEKEMTALTLDRTFDLEDDFSLHGARSVQGKGSTGKYLSSEHDEESYRQKYSSSIIELRSGRLDYKKEIPNESCVFCQGSAGFVQVVAAACHGKKGVRLYLDQ